MSFKQYFIKKIAPTYCMIVTLIDIGVTVLGLTLYQKAQFGFGQFAMPLLMGSIGCLPLLMDYFTERKRSRHIPLAAYYAIQLVMLEIGILAAAWYLRMIRSPLTAAMVAAMVVAIFTVVAAVMYLSDKNLCDSMNDALASYKEPSEN